MADDYDQSEFDEETKQLIRLVDRDKCATVLQAEHKKRKARVLEDFDHEQDPHVLARHLEKTLTQCVHLLNSHPYEVLKEEIADETEACRRLWQKCFFVPAYARVEKGRFSLSDWTWITWAHLHLVSEESPRVWGAALLARPVSWLQELHAVVRMAIREFGDLAAVNWPQEKLRALEDRCAGVVVLGKEMIPDAVHEMRQLTRLSDKIIMTSPLTLDDQMLRLMATNDYEHPAHQTMDLLGGDVEEEMQQKNLAKQQQRKEQKEQGTNVLDDITAFISVRSSLDNQVDMDKPFHDHRLPEYQANKNKVQLYLPEVFDFGDFVADSARLFYWTSMHFKFLAQHQGRIRPAQQLSDELMTEYAQGQIYKRLAHRATQQITAEAETMASDLYYKARVPLGSRDAYARHNLIDRDAINPLLLIQLEMGDKAAKQLSDQKEHRPDLVLPEVLPAVNKRHTQFEEWIWVLWGRLMDDLQIAWLKDWFIMLDDLPRRMQDTEIHEFNLAMPLPWRVLCRRPLVLWLGGQYFVQSVVEAAVAHPEQMEHVLCHDLLELWSCRDALETINCWLALMLLRHDCTLLNGLDAKHKFHKFLLDPHLTVRHYVEDPDEEALERAMEDWF